MSRPLAVYLPYRVTLLSTPLFISLSLTLLCWVKVYLACVRSFVLFLICPQLITKFSYVQRKQRMACGMWHTRDALL